METTTLPPNESSAAVSSNPPPRERLTRWQVALLILILAAHTALLIHCAVSKSACYDEGPHLSAGLAYLKYNETSIYNLSPPLLRMWAAIPAYLAGAEIPPAKPLMDVPARLRHWVYFDNFQAKNLPYVHEYILWGRFMLMPLSILAAAVVFHMGRRLYGATAGLISCAAWSFCPVVIAQGSTLGTDMGTALAFLVACELWMRFLLNHRHRTLLATAVVVGLAMAMKFTSLLLGPLLIVIAALLIVLKRAKLRDSLLGLVVIALISFVILNASYRFRLTDYPIGRFTFISSSMQRVQRILPDWLPIPLPRDLISGFDAQKWEAEGVYVTPLFGEAYFGGDWRYYPWLLLTRTTIGALLLLILCTISFFIRRPTLGEAPLLILIAIAGFGMVIGADINNGIRYLLPVYAPAMILFGRCIAIPRLKTFAIIATLALAVESVAATPRYHSFCNVISRQWRGSIPDQDWGQSLIELRHWMKSHNQDRVCLLYLGSVDPAAYGIATESPFGAVQSEYTVMSRTLLDGVPIRISSGFCFVRPWRELRRTPHVADLGGLVVFRTQDVLEAAGNEPWIVRVQSWDQVLNDPKLARLRNYEKRLLREP